MNGAAIFLANPIVLRFSDFKGLDTAFFLLTPRNEQIDFSDVRAFRDIFDPEVANQVIQRKSKTQKRRNDRIEEKRRRGEREEEVRGGDLCVLTIVIIKREIFSIVKAGRFLYARF